MYNIIMNGLARRLKDAANGEERYYAVVSYLYERHARMHPEMYPDAY